MSVIVVTYLYERFYVQSVNPQQLLDHAKFIIY